MHKPARLFGGNFAGGQNMAFTGPATTEERVPTFVLGER
jgi:hypothetical protein